MLLVAIALGLMAILFKSCQKDDVEIYPSNSKAPSETNQDSVEVSYRNGETFPIFYPQTSSVSYHQKFYQEAWNLDSILRIHLIKAVPGRKTKVLGTVDKNYTNKPAALYNITVYLKNGKSMLFFNHWVKDSTYTFQIIPDVNNNLVVGAFRYRSYRNDSVSMRYYDTDYKVFKNKFNYTVIMDTLQYRDFIPANSRGAVFWLNHKM